MRVRLGRVSPSLVKVQPAWDLFYTTGLLYLSGGWISPFVFLYPLIIIGGAVGAAVDAGEMLTLAGFITGAVAVACFLLMMRGAPRGETAS